MSRSPTMVLGIVAAVVLGLGVTLFVMVRQDREPVVATPAPAQTPAERLAPEPDRVVGTPTVQIHHPGAAAAAAGTTATTPPPPADGSATPAPHWAPTPPQREGRRVPATVEPTSPVERVERPAMDPDSKAAEELKRRGNRRFTNGMLPMLSAPQPATPPPTPAPTP